MIQFSFRLLGLLALLCFSGKPALAAPGFVSLGQIGQIYADYRPAAAGRPTLVLLNGLTYSLRDWDAYVAALTRLDAGLGVLRFDMTGMGETLLRGKLPIRHKIDHSGQVELTAQLMKHFGLRKAFIAGLSYGGGIAVAFATAHPEMVEQLILMAPFTEPLKGMDQYIRDQIYATRLTFPFNPAGDDELYDFFLRQFIYTVYPSLERSVLENPFKLEAIYRMIQGIRKYDTLGDARRLPARSTHLMVAAQDQYIPRDVQDRFWNSVPLSARASRVDISRSEHKIPEAVPAFAAAWTKEILDRRNELNRGLHFAGSTSDFTARAGSVVITLPKTPR